MIWHLHTLGNDHHDTYSYYLSPYKVTEILLTSSYSSSFSPSLVSSLLLWCLQPSSDHAGDWDHTPWGSLLMDLVAQGTIVQSNRLKRSDDSTNLTSFILRQEGVVFACGHVWENRCLCSGIFSHLFWKNSSWDIKIHTYVISFQTLLEILLKWRFWAKKEDKMVE